MTMATEMNVNNREPVCNNFESAYNHDGAGDLGIQEEANHAIVPTPEHFQNIDVIEINKQGRVLLCASGISSKVQDGAFAIYADISAFTSALPLPALPAGGNEVYAQLVNDGIPDAKWIDQEHFVLATDAGGVELWRAVCGEQGGFNVEQKWSRLAHDDIVYCVDMQCGGGGGGGVGQDEAAVVTGTIVSGGGDGKIDMLDIETALIKQSLLGHTDIVWGVSSHPTDPNLFLSCSQDQRVLMWDMRKDKPAQVVATAASNSPSHVPTALSWQPSPAHTFVMCCGLQSGGLVSRDVRQGMEGTLTHTQSTGHGSGHRLGHGGRTVNRVRFSETHSDVVCSVSDDCSVTMTKFVGLDAQQIYHQAAAAATGHRDMVKAVAWSGATCYTGAWDGRIHRHHLPAPAATSTPTAAATSASCH